LLQTFRRNVHFLWKKTLSSVAVRVVETFTFIVEQGSLSQSGCCLFPLSPLPGLQLEGI